MGYRYCPECDRWLRTAEYTVDEIGETVCPEHKAVHGFIIDAPYSERKFESEHSYLPDMTDELRAAKEQGLVR